MDREGKGRRASSWPAGCGRFHLTVLFAVVAVGLVAAPSSGLFPPPTATPDDSSGLASASGPPAVNATFWLNSTPIDLSPYFWGTTVTPRARLLPQEGPIVNATPSQVVVWPGGSAGDDYNPLTNTIYSVNAGQVEAKSPPTSEAQFAAWCQSIDCSTIMQIPGEADNVSLAVQIVNYTVNTLGLHPRYWEIGNEPELWQHWGLPWNEWTESGHTVTPAEYAWEVHNYTAALKAAFPSIQIIGIAETARPNGPWNDTVWAYETTLVNGENLSGVAVHVYPAGAVGPVTGNKHSTLQSFYNIMNAYPGLPARVDEIRNATERAVRNSTCPSCSPPPVFVTEVGSGLSHHGFSQFSLGFPGALDMAAQMTQAMSLNVTNQDIFGTVANTVNSWFNLSGVQRPDYTVYSQILSRLGSEAFQVGIVGPGTNIDQNLNHSLFAIDTIAPGDQDRADLLVVNTNLTSSVAFSPAFAEPAGPTDVWWWNGTTTYTGTNTTLWASSVTPTPVAGTLSGGLPANWTIPPQSLVLFESYPRGSEPVQVNETGLAAGTRWFVSLDGRLSTTTASNLTVLLPPGEYAVSAEPIPLPLGTFDPDARERLDAAVSSPIAVGSTPVLVPLRFVDQWNLSLSVVPSYAGVVEPAPSWANASEPLELAAVPNAGWAFSRWSGWGPGSVNGTSPIALVTPAGPISEKAVFKAAYNVTFAETGLPTGTLWSVALRGQSENSTDGSVSFAVANGSYGFHVANVTGYRALPPAGSVNISGGPVVETITFSPLHSAPRLYPITFSETGLPKGTNWSVRTRNVTESTTSTSMVFTEPNGTSGFHVGNVSGYRAHPNAGSVTVAGGPASVLVEFEATTPPPALYAVTLEESGLPLDTMWSATVSNRSQNSTSPTLVFDEANGTRGYAIGDLSGFRARPSAGSVRVAGEPVLVTITFNKTTPPAARYPVTFVAAGLPEGTLWSVTVRNQSLSGSTGSVTTQLPNGSYGYRLGVVPGYRPDSPDIGFVVRGGPVAVPVVFEVDRYLVTWSERGLYNLAGNGPFFWAVAVDGTTYTANGANVSLRLGNGSWVVRPVTHYADFVPSEPSVTVVVAGSDQVLAAPLTFVRASQRVPVVAYGLPSNLGFQIRLSDIITNETVESGDVVSESMIEIPNGTYTFDVASPGGYYPRPSHGNLTVSATAAPLVIYFFPTGPGSIPSLWSLGAKALLVGSVIGGATWGGFVLIGRIDRRSRPPEDDR